MLHLSYIPRFLKYHYCIDYFFLSTQIPLRSNVVLLIPLFGFQSSACYEEQCGNELNHNGLKPQCDATNI